MPTILKPEALAPLRMTRIGDLPENPVAAAVYAKKDGTLYCRLNERFHVVSRIGPDGSLLGDGIAEEIDPDEEVYVIKPKQA